MNLRLLPLLLALLTSGCAGIYSAERFAPSLVPDELGLRAESADEVGRFGGLRWRWSGEDRYLVLANTDEGPELQLSVAVRDRDVGAWAAGPLLPIIPLFGLGSEPRSTQVQVELRLLDAGRPVTITPGEVRLLLPGTDDALLPGAATALLSPTITSVAVASGAPVELAPGDRLELRFPATFDAERLTLLVPLQRADGSVLTARVQLERVRVTYYVIAS